MFEEEYDGIYLQLQKQLELIQGVCQSMLDQCSLSNNVQNLRNNLTPSPIYAEPRSFMSPNVQNVVNLPNPLGDPQYFAANANQQHLSLADMGNTQNMLAVNTLQTQAFLLNTLNQCSQMLWFQQREIASLRNMLCVVSEISSKV